MCAARKNSAQSANSFEAPANGEVKYKTETFDGYFFEPSPYTRVSKEEKNKNWEALYEFGISGIPRAEAAKLTNETLANPDNPDEYMIQLEVFHNLHCLNMIRKQLYPDEYPELWEYWENGTVNHFTLQAKHIDHCIDQLRQSLMCNSDVTPVVFGHNFFGRGIYPKLIATHTCRDFYAISDWAKAREVENYNATGQFHDVHR
ncbi:hypothetical protein CC86DRAFT_279384 [Ophiobolus disseminans]|uniref:Uncharacterized protein n=1 Tax=Ophiobolus disseminans TaxID=1469910 RepID=A0A6A7AP02_9PLEO|nr:hypothetical protein CC86DRAFT_279384 [Ophiobolus disseminans]